MKKRIPNNLPTLIKDVMRWSLDFEDYNIIQAVQHTKNTYSRESLIGLETIIEANKQSLLMMVTAMRILTIKMITLEDMIRVQRGLSNKGNATPKMQDVTAK